MKYDVTYVLPNESKIRHYLVRADNLTEAKLTFMAECPDFNDDDRSFKGDEIVIKPLGKILAIDSIDDSKITDFRLEVISRDVLRFFKERICRNNSACFLDFMHYLKITDDELIGLGFEDDVMKCQETDKDEIER